MFFEYDSNTGQFTMNGKPVPRDTKIVVPLRCEGPQEFYINGELHSYCPARGAEWIPYLGPSKFEWLCETGQLYG